MHRPALAATATPSVARRVAVVLTLLLIASFLPFFQRAAHAASGSVSIESRTPVSIGSKPYDLTISASDPGFGTFINIVLTRVASSGNEPTQTHSYDFFLDSDTIQVASTLLPSSVDTGTQLGSFGKVVMSLKNASSLHTEKSRCPDPNSDIVLSTTKTRNGNLVGNLTLNAHDTYFETVHLSSLPVTVTKVTPTGNFCPGGGGGGTVCPTGYDLFANQPAAPISMTAAKSLKGTGDATITLTSSETVHFGDHVMNIFHEITGSVPRSAFQIGTAGVVVNAGSLAPFASGKISFTNGQAGAPTGSEHCKQQSTPETYDTGSVTADYDSRGHATLDKGLQNASLSKTFHP
jgi:hypothetical protein